MRFPAPIVALVFACCTASVPDDAPAPTLASHAHPLTGAITDYDPLIRAVGRSSVVLLGEATHGTHESAPSLPKSHGAILHETGLPRFLLILSDMEARAVTSARLQRAVGVIYRPMTEYASHYVTATLREQFDAVVHVDETKAVTPLD